MCKIQNSLFVNHINEIMWESNTICNIKPDSVHFKQMRMKLLILDLKDSFSGLHSLQKWRTMVNSRRRKNTNYDVWPTTS